MKKFLTRKTFKGLYAVLPTPFDKCGSLSWNLFRKMMNTMAEFEIDGVILAGTNGEYFSLEEKEKVRMTEIAAEILAPMKINLVVGGTALSLQGQIRLGRKLRKAGAQALINMVPIAPILSDEEYCDFWKRLADKVGDIGLVIYILESMGNMPNVESLVKLAENVPGICGTKEGHRNFKRWQFLHENTNITPMPANDYDWMKYYKKGCVSMMTPSVGMCPHLSGLIHTGFLDHKWKVTEPLLKDMTAMWDFIISDLMLTGYGGIARFKALCRALGWIDPGFSRPPLINVSEDIQMKMNQKITGDFPNRCKKK